MSGGNYESDYLGAEFLVIVTHNKFVKQNSNKESLTNKKYIMPIDPVCWMHVDRMTEFTTEYNGQTYYFCSIKCKKEFEKAPDKYLGVKSPMKMPD